MKNSTISIFSLFLAINCSVLLQANELPHSERIIQARDRAIFLIEECHQEEQARQQEQIRDTLREILRREPEQEEVNNFYSLLEHNVEESTEEEFQELQRNNQVPAPFQQLVEQQRLEGQESADSQNSSRSASPAHSDSSSPAHSDDENLRYRNSNRPR